MLPKRLFALTLFAAIAAMHIGAVRAQTWQYTNGPYANSVNKKICDVIAFAKSNDTMLFAASDTDGVFSTSDAGDHWQHCWVSPGNKVNCIAAKGLFVLIGTTKGLVRSTDGGASFDSAQDVFYRPDVLQLVHDTAGIFYTVAGFSPGGSGSNIECFRSGDGGLTWDTLTSLAGLTTQAVVVDSSNQLLYVGYPPPIDPNYVDIEIWKSRDAGAIWSRTQAPYYLEDGVFYGACPNGDLYVSSLYQGLIRSNDSAYDLWDLIGYPGTRVDIPHHFAFLNSSIFCAAGEEYIYLTNDGWTTWETIAGRYQEFPACEFAFHGDLFAAADSGVTRLNPGSLVVQSGNGNQPLSFQLSNEYPNKLSVMTEAALPARIELFDLVGRRVATVADEKFPAGRTTVSLPPLPVGIYFAHCESASGSQSCKFIIGP